jgi:hypothetical protein
MTGDSFTSMTAPLVDLARLVAGIRWRRRLWMSSALLGLFLGALFTAVWPTPPSAVTSLLVAHADDQNAKVDALMETDVALCQTSEVAGAALKELNINKRPGDFLATYHCTSAAPHVLTITAAAASESEAVRYARALADAFIADHVKRAQDAADAKANTLLDRRARLERTVARLNSTISSTAAPAQLDALYTARAGLASQILDLARQADDARVGVPAIIAGTRLVDPARPVPSRGIRAAVTNTGVGLILGLGIGLAVSAVLSVTADRPVLRRDIAAELGVSIIAQLPSPPRGPRRLWRRSRQVRDRQRVAATLARVVRRSPSSISLLEIGCPGTAAALALEIAGRLAPERPVVIVTDLRRENLREAAQMSGNPARIVDVADLALDEPSRSGGPEICLGVGTVGPGASWVDLSRLGADTLLIVRAGHATTLGLHTVARQLVQSEIRPIGVVLVHPYPKDRSDGTLWDGLHAVLRDRSATNGTPLRGQRPAPSDNGQPVFEPSSAVDEE